MDEVLTPTPYLDFLCYLHFTLGPLYYFLKKEKLNFNYFIILMMLWCQFTDKDISEHISNLNFLKFQAFNLIMKWIINNGDKNPNTKVTGEFGSSKMPKK